jgi:CRISPR-associated protein Csd1
VRFNQTGQLEEALRDKARYTITISFLHSRMSLMKAFHIRKGDKFMSTYLNEEHPSTAYQCGRLMAVLAAIQYSALGKVSAGIIQRYYAAASTTPALVLGRLTRTSQFHLSDIGKSKPGLAYSYETKIARIWSRIKDQVPTWLPLEDQSLFALGYYQQLASERILKTENDNSSEEKEHE